MDLLTGQEVYRLQDISSSSIESVVLSPDEKYLATISYANQDAFNKTSKRVKVWPLQSMDLVPELCSRLTRNLRDSEWIRFFGEEPYKKTCPNIETESNLDDQSSSTSPQSVTSIFKWPKIFLNEAPQVMPSSFSNLSSPTEQKSYQFEFPQLTCGDQSSNASAIWHSVFIDDGNLEEIRSKYCADSLRISKREDTGQPSIQVASFIDRDKAKAFADIVDGEVGAPHQLKPQ